MHRSGTSLTAGLLARLGFELSADLLPPTPDNPLGYFEDRSIVDRHDRFLHEIGFHWSDPRPLPLDWASSSAARRLQNDLHELLQNRYRGLQRFVIKDPRLCRLLPLWLPVLTRHGVRVCCLLVWRHPAQVAASLANRDGIAPEHAALLWLRHQLAAEVHSRGLPRSSIWLPDLLADPVGRLERALGELTGQAPHPATDPAALRDFVRSDLYRHRSGDFMVFPRPLRDWLEQICAAISPQPDRPTFDRVRKILTEYDGFAEHCFGVKLTEIRERLRQREQKLAAINDSRWWRIGKALLGHRLPGSQA